MCNANANDRLYLDTVTQSELVLLCTAVRLAIIYISEVKPVAPEIGVTGQQETLK